MLIAGGLILGGPAFSFTFADQAIAQMMGNGGIMGMQSMMITQGQPVSVERAIQMMHNTPSYTKVVSHNNTIIFGSRNINIVALAMMRDTAINLTGMKPPSYSKGDVFVMYGLINPTLIIPKGASVQFSVINLDDDHYHNLLISSVSPPYPYMAMMSSMGTMSSNSEDGVQSNPPPVMASFLPPVDHSSAHEYSYGLTFDQSGTLWYVWTYPEHAQEGMYGKIIVTD